MSQVSTITSKGQVVIPKSIRDVYGLSKHSKVIFKPLGSKIIIELLSLSSANDQLSEKLSKFSIDMSSRIEWDKQLSVKLKKSKW